MISAPFSPEQVVELWNYQLGVKTYGAGEFQMRGHPFTCPNRSDADHKAIGSDTGMLVPTIKGWICPFCDYRQSWAHEFMCKPIEEPNSHGV